MGVKLLLLLNCVAFVVYCQNTTDPRNDGEWGKKFFNALRHEMESTRQVLSSQQKTGVVHDRRMMKELKSEIQDIRRIVTDQNQMLENIHNRLNETDLTSELQSMRQLLMDLKQSVVRSGTHTKKKLKSEIDEIREVVADQQNGSRNDSRNARCPPGFTYLPSAEKCYKVVFEGHDWHAAGKKCQALRCGSHLAAITSAAESSALKTFLASELSKNAGDRTWNAKGAPKIRNHIWTSGQREIEMNCRTPFAWKPSSDNMLALEFTDWFPSEPNCLYPIEGCLEMMVLHNFTWNTYTCSEKACPLCEYNP